jgi:Heterokaryon incompatibility protein (HET)
MAQYRYLPLRHNDSLRLVQIHPVHDDAAPIRCTIRRYRLSDPKLKYYAISYTWGESTFKVPIFCPTDAETLHVIENCHDTLRRIRREYADQLVWIDSLCINQQDLIERSVQVRIMDKIFATATRVVVDLGEATPGSDYLFEELAEADECEMLTGGFCRPLPNRRVVRELAELFKRPWFQRVWVIQEVFVNEFVTVVCGSAYASWEALHACVHGYHYDTPGIKESRPFVIQAKKFKWCPYPCPEVHLFDLLCGTHQLLATDHRDKVFALGSLISTGRDWVDALVDYTRSVEDIFTQVALLLLPEVGIRLLTAVTDKHDLNMASWVPDWSQNFAVKNKMTIFPDFEPRMPGFFSVQSSRLGFPMLTVKGSHYGHIQAVGEAFRFHDLDDTEKKFAEILFRTSSSCEQILMATSSNLPSEIKSGT